MIAAKQWLRKSKKRVISFYPGNDKEEMAETLNRYISLFGQVYIDDEDENYQGTASERSEIIVKLDNIKEKALEQMSFLLGSGTKYWNYGAIMSGEVYAKDDDCFLKITFDIE